MAKWLQPFLGTFFSPPHLEEDEGIEAQSINHHTAKLARHNATIASISRVYRSGVGSKTYNFQSKTGLDNFDRQFEEIVEIFSEKGNCELRGQKHRGMIERDIVDAFAVKHGGVIIRHHFDEKFACGYKMEIIPLYMVNTTKIGTTGSNAWVNGFKVNKYGAITHVAILDNFNSGTYSKDVPISQLEIAINPWADIVQYTGISPVLAIKETLEYIDQYKAKEMKGAGNRADTPFIIKSEFFKEAFDSIKERLREKRRKQLTTKEKIVWNEDEMNILNKVYSMSRLDMKNGDGMGRFAYIPKDEEVVETGKGVFTIYPEMYENEASLAASSMGLTAASVVGKNESSYNAALKGVQSEEREFKIVFEDVCELVWRGVYKNLLKGAVLKGMLPIKDYHRNKDNYFKIELLRSEVGHLDPAKTSKAVAQALKNKTTTTPREIRKQGGDPEAYIREEIDYEIKRNQAFKDAKLPLPEQKNKKEVT